MSYEDTKIHTMLSTPRNQDKLLQFYVPMHSLRLPSQGLLSRARTCTVTTTRAFKHSSVSVCNSLPVDIHSCNSLCAFRCHVKTFLFDVVIAHEYSSMPTNRLCSLRMACNKFCVYVCICCSCRFVLSGMCAIKQVCSHC